MTDEQTKERIRGILAEREHYVTHDMSERIHACDEELARLGHKAKVPAQRAQTRGPKSSPAQTRKAKP
jgi:hypothetical protein